MGSVILITGANGFLGSSLVSYWSQKNVLIIATDIQNNYKRVLSENTKYLSCDITDVEKLKQVTNEFAIDTIFHCAAIIGKDASIGFQNIMNVNVQGTYHIAKLAIEKNARLIFPSTAMVYGNNTVPFKDDMLKKPLNTYALSKSMAEDIIEYYGRTENLSYAIVRITVLFGAEQEGDMLIPSAIRALSNGLPYPMTKGEQTRDFIYITDILFLFHSLKEETINGVFHGGSGKTISIVDVVKLIHKKLNSESKIEIGKIPYREQEMWDYSIEVAKNNKLISWTSQIDIETGIQDVIDSLKNKNL